MYQGADNQNDKWPQNCASCDASLEGNDRQSPIDLNPKLTNMETKTLPKLTFNPNPNRKFTLRQEHDDVANWATTTRTSSLRPTVCGTAANQSR